MFIYILIILFAATEGVRYIYACRNKNTQTGFYLILTCISAVLIPILTICVLINHFVIQGELIAQTNEISFLVFMIILIGLECFNIIEIRHRIKNKDGVEK